MAQKRKKKPAQPQPFSPKRYIQEKARNFPIAGCFCSADWQDKGMAQVIVCREQPSGKFLIGMYLLDTWCLGIKDASCNVNKELADIKELLEIMGEKEEAPLEMVDYLFVHNLIYGVLEYAEDLGFRPHADFGLAQYVLEADTEELEQFDFEFGKDGKPFFVAGPFDNVNRILAILDRTVGKGNYDFMHPISM